MKGYRDAMREQRLKELRESFFGPEPEPAPVKSLEQLAEEAKTLTIEVSDELKEKLNVA